MRHPLTFIKEQRIRILLVIMMLGAGLFSVFMHFNLGIRLDESQSLLQSTGGAAHIIANVSKDVHMPLYHLMLAFWRTLFGSSPEAIRSLSLLFFLLTIPAMYLAARAAFGERTGLFAALMFSISPFAQWYASEARMYSLLALLSTLNLYFFVKMLTQKEESPSAWRGFVITTTLGFFTHYFFAIMSAFQWWPLFFSADSRKQKARKKLTQLACFFAGLACLWAGLIWYVGGNNAYRPVLPQTKAADISFALLSFILGFQSSEANTIVVASWPLLVLFSFLGLNRTSNISKISAALMITTLGPVLVLGLASLFVRPMFLSRYMTMIVPPLYVLIGHIACSFRQPLAWLAKSGLTAVMLWALLHQAIDSGTPVKEDYRKMAQYLTSKSGSNDIIIVSAPFTVFPLEYYYKGQVPIKTIPGWDRREMATIPQFEEGALPETVAKLMLGKEKCWLVLSCDQGYQKTLEQYFNSFLQRMEYREFSPGLTLGLFREGKSAATDAKPSTIRKLANNPIYGSRLYVNPNTPAKRQAKMWMETRPREAALLDKIAVQPSAHWLTGSNQYFNLDVKRIMAAAVSEKTVPCFVTYNIPGRDMGGHSTGGAKSPKEYLDWIQTIADAIGARKAVLILEPDTLGLLRDLPEREKETRLALLRNASQILGERKRIVLYLDAGHSNWGSAEEMAVLLRRAGIQTARGFALNVSNCRANEELIAYGEKLSKLLDGKPFVIDTSRNGLGPTDQLFNPPGRALGLPPSVNTGHPLVDAFLWIKNPGESDGTANGGPAAGLWWPEYAIGLAERARW